jgi:predicted amidohydrolase
MTSPILPIALVQMTSTEDRESNLDRAERYVRQAASGGAKLVALPENFAYLRSEGALAPWAEPLDGEIVTRFGRAARDHAIWLLLGSIPEESEEPPKVHNTSVLLRPDGTVAAVYRKIHLFDVAIPGKVELRESDAVLAGDEIALPELPWGFVGLTVCYDLRFPELFRALTLHGARLILVPSAFTAYTGPFHWEPLLKARAIENQVFIAAPAQTGRHSPTRASHGHSMIVDPWGEVLAEKAEGEGILSASLDMSRVEEVRRRLPCLDHARPWLHAEIPRKR